MEVIDRKTACLIEAACKVGALLARAPEQKVRALAQYGHNLGCAFQLVDDLLDYTADAQVLGKATGTDLKEGKLTLPLIHTLKKASPKDRRTIETIIRDQDGDDAHFPTILELVDRYGGITYTRSRAKDQKPFLTRCSTRYPLGVAA